MVDFFSSIMLVLIMIAVIFGFLFISLQRKRNKTGPPVMSGGLPIIGHAHLILGSSTQLWNLFKDFYGESKKYNGIFSFNLGPMTIYVITDSNDFLTVANTCLQKNRFYEFAKPLIGEGLITGEVPIWKIHRKLLNPAFNQAVIDGYLDVFNKQSRRLVEDLEIEVDKEPFHHYTYIKSNSLETICLTAFGVNLNEKSELNSQYIIALDHICNVLVERLQKPWFHNNFMFNWSNLKKKLDKNIKIVNTMSETILQKTKAEYLRNKDRKVKKTQEPKFKSFMQLLIELASEKGALSDREIRDEVNTMIAAGYETSATALMFCMLMIGSYPKVQEKIFEELNEVFGDDDRDVTKDDLSRLIYLEAVLKESLRIYPVVPIVTRYLDKDIQLSNCTLSKGSTCLMFIYGIHHSSIWGPDAEEFKPERWLDPASLPKSATAFVGFSIGRRNCIGRAYAIMYLKTVLAHVLRNYEIKSDYTKMELKFDVVLKPASGDFISIQSRNYKNCI